MNTSNTHYALCVSSSVCFIKGFSENFETETGAESASRAVCAFLVNAGWKREDSGEIANHYVFGNSPTGAGIVTVTVQEINN